jgi:hypothetical protein
MAKTGIRFYYENGTSSSITSINCGNSQTQLSGTIRLTPFTGLTAFNGGNNGLQAVTNFNLLTNLKRFEIIGTNTVAFNINTLPTNLEYFDIRGANRISGNINTIKPALRVFNVQGSNSTSGNINTLSSLLVYCNTGLNTTIGDISSLKINCPNLTVYVNNGSNSTTGDIELLPDNLTTFETRGFNTIFGNISGIPNTLKHFVNTGSNSTSGDISSLPNLLEFVNWGNNITFGDVGNLISITPNLTSYSNRGFNTTTGNISSLPANLLIYENHGNNTTTGSINSLPANLLIYENLGNNTTSGRVELLPGSLQRYINSGTNAVSGSIVSLSANSNINYFQNSSLNNRISGDIQNLPAALEQFIISGGSGLIFGNISTLKQNLRNFTVAYGAGFTEEGVVLTNLVANFNGDVSALPRNMTSFQVDCSGKIVCNFKDLPPKLQLLNIRRASLSALNSDHEFYGDLNQLPRDLRLFRIDAGDTTTSKISGDLASIPRLCSTFSLYLPNNNVSNFQGKLSALPSNTVSFTLYHANNTFSDNLSSLPSSVTAFVMNSISLSGSLENLPSIEKYRYIALGGPNKVNYYDGVNAGYKYLPWGTMPQPIPFNMLRVFQINSSNFPVEHLVTLLIDLSGVSNWSLERIATFNYPSMPTISLSNPTYGTQVSAAIAAIQAKGVTLSVNTTP